MSRKSGLQPINPVLNKIFNDLGISDRIKLDSMKRSWPAIFSGPLAEHTAPVDLKEDTLVVAVDSPVWLQHLKFIRKDIAAKLTQYGVKDIKLKHGKIVSYKKNLASNPDKDRPVFRKLSEKETESIENALSFIEDKELKALARSALIKSASRKKQ